MAAKDAKDAKADKAKDAKAKDKEREAKRKAAEKEKAAKAKEKEKAREAKEKEKAARAKEKEREQKAKDKQRDARRKEKEREARFAEKHPGRHRQAHDDAPADAAEQAVAQDEAAAAVEDAAADTAADTSDDTSVDTAAGDQPVQAAEDVEVAERGDTTDVASGEEVTASGEVLSPLPELDVPDNDKTVRPKGYLAEALDKEDAVNRSTQRATLAASYTTRDHDLIRAWAQSRGGRPADVEGTGNNGGAGVLRIEFPDGPGDDSRLEDVDWGPFFQTFDESDVDFLYQERVRTGDVSRFHKIVRADA